MGFPQGPIPLGDDMNRHNWVWGMIVFAACCLQGSNALAAPAGAAADTVRVGLTAMGVPAPVVAQPGDTLTVDIEITQSGPDFNAYDAYLRFDPTVLEFLPPVFLSDQIGPLMLDACPQSFHIFSQSPDSMSLEVHFSLLCAGVSVTGPGVIYQLKFRCRNVNAYTHLDLLDEPGRETRFIMNGYLVKPVAKSGLLVQVGSGAAPAPELQQSRILLRAGPNPFNPRVEFAFSLPKAGPVDLAVYDLRGRLVRQLMTGGMDAGPCMMFWDGRDSAGRPCEAGVYCGLVRAAGMTGRVLVTLLP